MSVTVVAHNMLAAYGSRQLNITANSKQKSVEKLSSGYRINRSADDAAGLSISEKMRRQIRGLSRGEQNSQDGISFCQVADGAMNEIQSMLHRMNELCIQAANGTNSQEDRQSIQSEINQLKLEIDRISDTTTFNDIPVFHDVGDSVPVGGIEDVIAADKIKGSPGFSEPLVLSASAQPYRTGMPATAATEGMPGYAGQLGFPYSSVMMDYSGLGSDYSYSDLIGQSFSVTDASTGKEYSIVFGDSTDTGGRPYSYTGVGEAHTITLNVEGQTSAYRLTQSLFTAMGNVPDFINGGIQYARDGSGKLWIYDNKTANFGNSSMKFASPAGSSGGDEKSDIWIQSGDTAENGLYIKKPYLNSSIIGIDGVDVTSPDDAKNFLAAISSAIDIVSGIRGEIGAQQNRIEHTINVTATTKENLEASESKIRDTDMATEIVKNQKQSVLEQAGQSMLSQANQMPQGILNLLQ